MNRKVRDVAGLAGFLIILYGACALVAWFNAAP